MKKEEIKQLLQQMTLDEKIGQLLQLTGNFYSDKLDAKTGPMEELNITDEEVNLAGSILNISGAEEVKRIQTTYLKKSRLKIPLLFMADIIHGFKTIFPIPLALGSSWNPNVGELMAKSAAKEASVSGLHVTFSPMVDLVRDPRWGRVLESTGEDPYLNGLFASAFVNGYQGDSLNKDDTRIAACVKHFAAYGGVIAGREYNTVDMSTKQLKEMYLPSYKKAIEAGVKLVMTAFTTIEGIPSSGNKWLLRDILRKEFQFEGVTISDWGAIKELIPHGVAENERAAAKLGIEAGVDIEMMSSTYFHSLKSLVEDKSIDVNLINEAVFRILHLKNELGLFENPLRGSDAKKEKEIILSDEIRTAAKYAAEKSMVLLKNDATLPIDKNKIVAIVGPGAKSHDILGSWSAKGEKSRSVTLEEGAKKVSSKILVGQEMFSYLNPSEKAVSEAVSLCQKADVVVIALGEPSRYSGEAASVTSIKLPQEQIKFYQTIRSVHSHVVVTLYNGRPLDLGDIQDANAIVEAWFPGTEGGEALANILWGRVNPSGRLSMSFPKTLGQVPIFYNEDHTGRPFGETVDPEFSSRYIDMDNYPLYPFGYGLSYSHFKYEDITVSQKAFSNNQTIFAKIKVTNQSDYHGTETVQLYIRDVVGEVVRPIKELKGFQQIDFSSNEEKEIVFEIREDMLRYFHSNGDYKSDAGEFVISIGPNSQDLYSISIYLT